MDIAGIARAVWQSLRTGERIAGTSTLTQQLARNLYLTETERNERSLRRKLREAWLAWRLERSYSKDGLLALYLNTTYYGHFAVGIEAAAQAYFGVHARELDLAQCALLAGLPQYPAGYNPIENLDAARRRQRLCWGCWSGTAPFRRPRRRTPRQERLAFASTPFPIEAPHFVMWVQGQLEALVGRERLAAGGLRVTTTLDLDWQRQAEAIVRRRLAQLQPCAAGAPAGDCDATADPAAPRGKRRAGRPRPAHRRCHWQWSGSPDYFDPAISGAVNTALALRQPGSAIKPLTYAAALDPERARRAGRAPWTAATLIADLRAAFLTAESQPYVPQNYDRKYHGPVTVRTALANSYNIPAVKTLDAIGVDALIEQAARLGIPWDQEAGNWKLEAGRLETGSWKLEVGSWRPISNLQPPTTSNPSRFGLALTLGGGEVRLLDLTAAYAAFANGGRARRTVCYQQGGDSGRKGYWVLGVGYQWAPTGKWSRDNPQSLIPQSLVPDTALDPRVAFLITDILSDDAARMPAFGQNNWLEIGRPAAAKTGTTTDWRDNWTIGYTQDLAAGVWVGNADNTPMKDVSGITGAGPIWHDFMVTVLRDSEPQGFPRPDGLAQVEVCADSGLLPGGAEEAANGQWGDGGGAPALPYSRTVPCPNRHIEWFIAGTEPTQVDRSHLQVAIDARTGKPAEASTRPEFVQAVNYWQLPGGVPGVGAGERHPAACTAGAARRGAREHVIAPRRLAGPRLKLTSPDPNRSLPDRSGAARARAAGADHRVRGGRVDRSGGAGHAAGRRHTVCRAERAGLYCLVDAGHGPPYVPGHRHPNRRHRDE